jgi:molecular chaperone GrpE
MSEPAPPRVAETTADDHPQALSPEAARALADFRSWLAAAAPAAEPSPAEAVDLFTLLAQFTALRHEVNLQTRAVRAQQEQNAESLRQLSLALEAARQAPAAPEDRLRPLLQTLIDLHDALSLAGREIGRAQETVLPSLQQLTAALEPPKAEPEPALADPPRPSWWARLFGARAPDVGPLRAQRRRERQEQEERARQALDALGRVRQALGALTAGYSMSLQRLDRALRQHGLEAIPAVGRPFDPESMEVLEAAADSGRPAGEVLDEVRRGYLLNGRVFRFAQVRVAK